MGWTNFAIGLGQVLVPTAAYFIQQKWGITGTQIDGWIVAAITALSAAHSGFTTTAVKT